MLRRRLEYDFLACLLRGFVSYFSFSVFLFFFFFSFILHPAMFLLFVFLRLCSNHQRLSTSTYFVARVLSACCVICTLPYLGTLMAFIHSLFLFGGHTSRVAFFYFALVPGTPAHDLTTWNILCLVFLCLIVTTEFVYL